jgi:hypothetical protein
MDAIERSLGETRLERRFRMLSGTCLAVLMGSAFLLLANLLEDSVAAPGIEEFRATLVSVGVGTMFLMLVANYVIFRCVVGRRLHQLAKACKQGDDHSELGRRIDELCK